MVEIAKAVKRSATTTTPKTKTTSPNSKRQIVSEVPYKCTRCGKTFDDPKSKLIMSKTSPLFTGNDLYSSLCFSCANELFDELRTRHGDKMALMLMCGYIDIYFSEELYESIKSNANFSFGNYLKLINGNQYKAKNFATFLLNLTRDNQGLRGATEIQRGKEVDWKASDRKNKNYVLQTIGYDCFEDDNYSDENRKFLFNTLADYLTDDVVEDPHKLQSVITMVKTTLQVEHVDRLINAEFATKKPDSGLVDSLTKIKKNFLDTVNKTANENGISAKTSGKGGKGANALTSIMKEMAENGFEEIKVNLFNVKMSEAFKNIADISNRSLIDQLNWQSDDYARMVANQREIIQNYELEQLKLEEENRLLKVEINNYKVQKKQTEGMKK